MMRAKHRNRKKDAATVFQIHEKFFASQTGYEASGGFPLRFAVGLSAASKSPAISTARSSRAKRAMASARHYPGLNSPGFARKTDKIEKP